MADKPTMAIESWARTYRPRKFKDLVGQDTAISLLRGKIKQGKLPGFLMFVGPSGCGKTTIARLLARYVNCDKGTACGLCASCMHDPDNHPDVNELNAAEARGIDDVRNLIQQARYKPRYNVRIILIDEAHQLTPQAAQAFLKPLEDTPKSTMYVVCTTDPEKMPTAMLTRATTIQVRMPIPSELRTRLDLIIEKEGLKMKPELLDGIIEYSGGYVRSAINLLENAGSLLADDPKADAQKVLVKLGVAAEPESAAVAMRLVISMHKGSKKNVVKAIFDMDEPVPAIMLALRYNEYLMGVLSIKGHHPKLWHTKDCQIFLGGFKKHIEKPSIVTASEVQTRLTTVRNQLVTVSTGSRSLLLGGLL